MKYCHHSPSLFRSLRESCISPRPQTFGYLDCFLEGLSICFILLFFDIAIFQQPSQSKDIYSVSAKGFVFLGPSLVYRKIKDKEILADRITDGQELELASSVEIVAYRIISSTSSILLRWTKLQMVRLQLGSKLVLRAARLFLPPEVQPF